MKENYLLKRNLKLHLYSVFSFDRLPLLLGILALDFLD